MPVIKRYPNRKLYDTEEKRYITLDGIADLIRKGDEVVVIDHLTAEDLTAITLTQIIFEQEKKKGGFLPKSVLTGLVQAGGDTINTLRRSLSVPLDLFHQVDNEIERRLQVLISKGEIAKEEGLNLRDKLLSFNSSQEEQLPDEKELESLLTRHGVPTRDDIERLNSQIDALTKQLDSVLDSKRAAEESAGDSQNEESP
ncbi:MAG: polyhydroxyalkanoate synthesis regulator DNA-binding domain-containing protein [Candidatus Promineifilaceae bacterium]|nr:polyhydroxyalkanoate synthesis regulator DNA-binding domain-containing protein [Candidatus Promineifilaceae bacterium]